MTTMVARQLDRDKEKSVSSHIHVFPSYQRRKRIPFFVWLPSGVLLNRRNVRTSDLKKRKWREDAEVEKEEKSLGKDRETEGERE